MNARLLAGVSYTQTYETGYYTYPKHMPVAGSRIMWGNAFVFRTCNKTNH